LPKGAVLLQELLKSTISFQAAIRLVYALTNLFMWQEKLVLLIELFFNE